MKQTKLLIALTICAAPSLGYARSGPNNLTYVVPHGFSDVHLAQSSVDNISQSDLKRINFYSGRALEAVVALADADAAGGVASDANVMALRAAISRLVDAGKRSGLTQTETADLFQLAAAEKFKNNVPLALQGPTGEMDTRALFEGVAARSQFGTTGTSSQNYLDQLNAESSNMAPLVDPTKLDSERVQTAVSTPQLIEVENTEGEIADRVTTRNGERVITVAKGDTLAQYASIFYGDPLAYRQIFLANGAILASPNDLVVGTELVLPRGN